jgi:hypothetical protein
MFKLVDYFLKFDIINEMQDDIKEVKLLLQIEESFPSISVDGIKIWRLSNGQIHRIFGPAMIGHGLHTQRFFLCNIELTEDEHKAIIQNDIYCVEQEYDYQSDFELENHKDLYFFKNQKLHREDGPAFENYGRCTLGIIGSKDFELLNFDYYIEGKKLTKAEFDIWKIQQNE